MSIVTPINTVNIFIEEDVLHEIIDFAEAGYPEEVAGLMLGSSQQNQIRVCHFLKVENHLGAEARSYSYQISSYDWQKGEREASRLAMEMVGVFHTHPDHPSIPSSHDLEFALPNFMYVIAAIHQGKLASIQAWKLREDRSQFDRCTLLI